jgi:hypothetical protein|tara:strand:+ start:7415 stop:7675 length:261 start_codon:yes stop_codon:yes gene_type:complete
VIEKELEVYFNNYFEMFRTQGWKQLVKEFSGNTTNINSVEQAKDEKDLFFRKGQLNIIATVLNLESQITASFENAENESDDLGDSE